MKPTHGRLKFYGRSTRLRNLFRSASAVKKMDSPLYDDKDVTPRLLSIDLL